MTIEILKETIVSQALEIQELKKEVKTLESNLVHSRLYSDKKIDEKLEIAERHSKLATANVILKKKLESARAELTDFYNQLQKEKSINPKTK